jgi:hypothetical protein
MSRVQLGGTLTVQCFMQRHLLLCLTLVACFPKAQASRSAEEPEEPEVSEWQGSDSRSSQAGPSDLERFSCYGALAVDITGRSVDVQNTLNAWFPTAEPLLPQFKYTPWDEIPAQARPLVQKEWDRNFREAIAKRSIELQVPISSLSCMPEHPNCDQLDPAEAGFYYSLVLDTHMFKFFEASKELTHGIEVIGIAVNSGHNSSLISAVSDQHKRLMVVHRAVVAFHRLLPRGAVLPPIEWPEQKPDPIECNGVLKTARQ